jgi:predicted transcriptional regulator
MMGRDSVTPYQVAGRLGHLERRFTLPVSSVIRAEVRTVPPDVTLAEFFDFHLLMDRRTTVPVVDGQDYKGLVTVDDLGKVDREHWGEVTVAEVATDPSRAAPGWQVSQAVRAMERHDLDVLPVVDRAGRFVGVVTTGEILRLDDILARSEEIGIPEDPVTGEVPRIDPDQPA